jgi:hypothetical protein
MRVGSTLGYGWLFASALYSAAVPAQPSLKPTAVEIAHLPRYCWAQMKVPGAKGEEYTIPEDCGPRMMSYCPGLLSLQRARRTTSDAWRSRFLADARIQVRATLRSVRKYPACSIAEHVNQAMDELNRLIALPPAAHR